MARKKPAKKSPELVTNCDYCGEPLCRTCQRTIGSAVCASGNNIEVAYYGTKDGESPKFFCCLDCKSVYREIRKSNHNKESAT